MLAPAQQVYNDTPKSWLVLGPPTMIPVRLLQACKFMQWMRLAGHLVRAESACLPTKSGAICKSVPYTAVTLPRLLQATPG
jgi:hypothetical protein